MQKCFIEKDFAVYDYNLEWLFLYIKILSLCWQKSNPFYVVAWKTYLFIHLFLFN